jgi:RNA 3'-terminal phosphate cyclase (RTC), insert domain
MPSPIFLRDHGNQFDEIGANVELDLVRPGFFPARGGTIRVRITPATKLSRLNLTERGPINTRIAKSVFANLPLSIAEREVKVATSQLDWPASSQQKESLERSRGPGNLISLVIASEQVTEVFTAFGQRGLPAECVASRPRGAPLPQKQRHHRRTPGRPTPPATGNRRRRPRTPPMFASVSSRCRSPFRQLR